MIEAAQKQPKAKRGARRLANLIPAEVAPVYAKRGFANADLAVHWPEIAGAGVAQRSRPIGLTWPRGGVESGAGATLTIACSGGFALELQQMSGVIMERINRRLGWRCVTRLVIKQTPLTPPKARSGRTAPTPEDVNEAGRIAAGIRSEGLKEALSRLGAAALARARRPGKIS